MQVIGKLLLQEFWIANPGARKPLQKWLSVVEEAEWQNWHQLKTSFAAADLVRGNKRKLVVFNVGGNKYRLITAVNFAGQVVIVAVVLTHKEYDKGKWKE